MNILIDCRNQNFSAMRGVAYFTILMIKGFIESGIFCTIIVAGKTERKALLENIYFNKSSLVIVNYSPVIGVLGKLPLAGIKPIGIMYNKLIHLLSYLGNNVFSTIKRVDVIYYPTPLINPIKFIPFITTIHALLNSYGKRDLYYIEKHIKYSNTVITGWPQPFYEIRKKYPYVCEKHYMVPFPSFITHVSYEETDLPSVLEQEFFFFPAVIAPRKNHSILIEAVGILKSEEVSLPQFVFTNGESKGELINDLKTMIKKHKIDDRFVFLENVSSQLVQALYKKCSAALSLSLSEAGSAPMHEGTFYGKPVFCSDTPETRKHADLFGVNPCYFDPQSIYDCSIKLKHFIAKKNTLYRPTKDVIKKIKTIDADYTMNCYNEIITATILGGKRTEWFPFKLTDNLR